MRSGQATRRPRRLLASVALAVLGAATLAVAGTAPAKAEDALERVRKQGFARIAIANEPPWTEIKPDGKVAGAAPDLAREIFKRLGVPDIQASVSEYGAMIPGLQARRFDIVDAGLFIKPERCRAVIFSEPNLCDAEAFAVKQGNPKKLVSYADINSSGAKVGVPGGGTEERLALAAGVPRDRVVVVPDGQSGIKMLQDGRIDAYALPALSINDLVKRANDAQLEVVTPVKDTPIFCAGAAFNKQDEALRDAYDKVLAEMKKSGDFAKIVAPYGFPAEAASLTTREKLCEGPN
ncbi:ectoine/hydroxyectoine ABC transporter substrate-binding protein EhuB [Benzoatithermus flavus]|uniref:Ectoine/hydroxyectoine ABC transporter substrate-binding protein EhuB n=1 Tax=Benzoatithermus flavus TaxID=3108223 RepID=A0ABU8XTR1_9PROT